MSQFRLLRRPFSRGIQVHRARSVRGFTLIELMIAMLLGLVVIGGVISVFIAGQRSYATNRALGDVQDGSRIAFELLARDIRDAGLTGCGNSTRVANVLNNQSTTWWADWGNAVHGYGAGTTLADPALVGTTHVSGTDSLQLLGARDSGMSVAATPSSTAANFKLNDPTSDLQTGDVIIVCDPDHATIVQVTSYTDSNVTVVHNTGSKTVPGNCSKGMGYPTKCDPGNPNGNGYQFGPNSQIFKFSAVDWYIGTNPDGGTSLYRVSVADTSGTPTAAAQEMVRDVTGMNLLYHQVGQPNFVDAKTVGTNWPAVDAVRVQLTLESVDKRAGTDAKAISRKLTATTTVRNRVQ